MNLSIAELWTYTKEEKAVIQPDCRRHRRDGAEKGETVSGFRASLATPMGLSLLVWPSRRPSPVITTSAVFLALGFYADFIQDNIYARLRFP